MGMSIKEQRDKIRTQKKEKYKKYLLSDEWAALKIDLFKHRGYSCERCCSKTKLHIHHLNYKNIFNEEPEDLIILCVKCHEKEHNKSIKKKKPIQRKKKKFKILSLEKKLHLKKTDKKAFRKYVKELKLQKNIT